MPSAVRPAVAGPPEDVLAHVVPGPDVIVPMVNGEPVALEANHDPLEDVRLHVPRTFGLNQLHVSQVLGFCESERPLVEVAPAVPTSAARPSRRASSSGSPTGATWLHLSASVEMLPVDWVNDPRVIARERDFVSINATTGSTSTASAPRDHRRALLVLERRPGRLRARSHVRRGRAGVHPSSCARSRARAAAASGFGSPRARW